MNWLRASLFAQIILHCYFQATQWLPLGDWNNQCPERDEVACGLGHGLSVPNYQPLGVLAFEGRLDMPTALYCIAITTPLWVFSFAYFKRWRWLMGLQIGFYAVWMALQIIAWWVPYALGATDAQAERYQRVFGQATQLLPSFGRHLPPDGMHFVLQILIGAVVASGLIGLSKVSKTVSSGTTTLA